MSVLSKGSLFPATLVPELFNKVKGRSALAKLSAQTPIAFNGNEIFTFTFDNEIDIIAENGAKSHGGVTVAPVTISPIKFEYGARVSDEFIYASEEARINILNGFVDGFAKKVARGLDLAAFHGVNPRTGNASAVVGTNNFDSAVSTTVTYAAATCDVNLDDAIAALGADADNSGMAFAPAFATALSKIKEGGITQFPEFRFGQKPDSFNGIALDVNKTVSDMGTDMAIVGNFADAFKWGYAKNIPLEVIEYGNPDNSQDGDLKGHNQVYLRAEVYLGWGILDASEFVRIVE